MTEQKIFADGFRFEKPRDGSPDFIRGRISIKCPEAIQFLTKHQNNAGWVNLDLKKSAKGTLYLELNTWKPTKREVGLEQAPVPLNGVEYPEEDATPEF